MKRCGLCGESAEDADGLKRHMVGVHGWRTPSPAARSSGRGRGCATLALIVLILYGIGSVGQTILPLSRGVRGNEGFLIAAGMLFFLLAGAVWWRWVRVRDGTPAPVSQPRPSEPSALARLLEHAREPDDTSTDYLPTAWLVRLDLAFRDHLWVRITTLLVGMIAVTLVVMLAFGAGILR